MPDNENFKINISGSSPEDILSEEEDLIIELEGDRYEIIDTVTIDDHIYVALLPLGEDDDYEEDAEFTILEMTDDPDDEENCILRTVDDEELYVRIGDAFLERFAEFDDEEDA